MSFNANDRRWQSFGFSSSFTNRGIEFARVLVPQSWLDENEEKIKTILENAVNRATPYYTLSEALRSAVPIKLTLFLRLIVMLRSWWHCSLLRMRRQNSGEICSLRCMTLPTRPGFLLFLARTMLDFSPLDL